MTTVRIPQEMQVYTQDLAVVTVSGNNVRQLIDELEKAYPGIKNQLMDEDKLKATLTIFVDGQLTRLGLLQPVTDDNEVIFFPAIVGG